MTLHLSITVLSRLVSIMLEYETSVNYSLSHFGPTTNSLVYIVSIGYGHVVTYLGFTSGVITSMTYQAYTLPKWCFYPNAFTCGVIDLCSPCAHANYVDGTPLVYVPHTVTVISEWSSV